MGKKGGSSSTTVKESVPEFQEKALTDLYGRASAASKEVQGLPTYERRNTNQNLADALQLKVASDSTDLGGGVKQIADYYTNQIASDNFGIQNLLGEGATNQTLDAVTAPLQRQLMESILPQVQDQAVFAGAEGGARDQLQIADTIRDKYTQPALEARAQLAFQDLLSRRQAGVQNEQLRQGASQMIPGLLQSGTQLNLLPAELVDTVGARQQEEGQNIVNEKIQSPFLGLNELSAIISGNIGGTTTTTPAGTSTLKSGLLGATGGAALGSELFPDSGSAKTIGALLGGLGGAYG